MQPSWLAVKYGDSGEKEAGLVCCAISMDLWAGSETCFKNQNKEINKKTLKLKLKGKDT